MLFKLTFLFISEDQPEDRDGLESIDSDDQDEGPALPMDLKHVPFDFDRLSPKDSISRSLEFYDILNKRRSVRFFSNDPVPFEVIKNIIKAAGNRI